MTLILMFYAVNGTSVGSGTSIMDKSLPSKMSTTMPNTVPADGIESKKVSSSSEKGTIHAPCHPFHQCGFLT